MKKMAKLTVAAMLLSLFALVPGAMAQQVTVAKLHEVLASGQPQAFWQVKADDLNGWIQQKKTDFVVVDARPNPTEYAEGHIPGAIQISVQDILSPANLAKLPKNKKVVLVCVTGQVQNLPVVILRALGYDAYTMAFGYAAWIPDYRGGQNMQTAIKNAADKKFPLVK